MVLLCIIGNLIGKLFGRDIKSEDETVTPCFRPGILLDSGISWVQVKVTKYRIKYRNFVFVVFQLFIYFKT